MQLMLNIELTDEQYNDLMSKSLDAVLDTEQVKSAVISAIINQIDGYLTAHPDIVSDFIKPKNAYHDQESQRREAIVIDMFRNATEGYQQVIRKTVSEYMAEILEKTDCDALILTIMHEVLFASVKEAFGTAVIKETEGLWKNIGAIQSKICNLSNRLQNLGHGY